MLAPVTEAQLARRRVQAVKQRRQALLLGASLRSCSKQSL